MNNKRDQKNILCTTYPVVEQIHSGQFKGRVQEAVPEGRQALNIRFHLTTYDEYGDVQLSEKKF